MKTCPLCAAKIDDDGKCLKCNFSLNDWDYSICWPKDLSKLKPSLVGKYRYYQKAVARLHGLLGGITIDMKLNEKEIVKLREWLEIHRELLDMDPFKSLCELIDSGLEDGYLDPEEKEEIHDWCADFFNESIYAHTVTNAIRRLHGVLSGIRLDGVVTDEEISELRDWLRGYSKYYENWPFNELVALLDRVLEDGVITEEERAEVGYFCDIFTEKLVTDPKVTDLIYIETWMRTGEPIYQPLTQFCDCKHRINFKGRTFCFTGPASYGKRTDLHALVEKAGGIAKNSVIDNLDYLVIGAQSSPCWVYHTYGRKIEKVKERIDKFGDKTVFIHEEVFVDQIGAKLGWEKGGA